MLSLDDCDYYIVIMRQIVGEELKVPLDLIEVQVLNTTQVIKDTGVRGSSSTRVHGGSAKGIN